MRSVHPLLFDIEFSIQASPLFLPIISEMDYSNIELGQIHYLEESMDDIMLTVI